jgi:hypothetical protein
MSPTNDPQEWLAAKNALNKQKEEFARFVQHQAEPTVSKEEEINELHRLTDEQNNMKDVENRRT